MLFSFFKKTFVLIFLTILTQVGGGIYLIYQPISFFIKKRKEGWIAKGLRFISFLSLYLLVSLLIIPPVANQFGRVPLPFFATKDAPIQPLRLLTCLMNRHYVNPQLKERIALISNKLQKEFKGTKVVYLDANFPFFNGFPLLPHLSHNDGKKLDLAFYYKDKKTGIALNNSPSFYGYGVFEEPRKGEKNQPAFCSNKGYWQYGITQFLTPQWYQLSMPLDEVRTKRLIQLLAKDRAIKKIFIEPHLKTRWRLGQLNKIRYHGCHAVRHDDHIHLQL